MSWYNDNFFEEIGWAPCGFSEDGTPWYLIPLEVGRIELERRGLLEAEDPERRTQPMNWGDIMADWPDEQHTRFLKKPLLTITAEMLR